MIRGRFFSAIAAMMKVMVILCLIIAGGMLYQQTPQEIRGQHEAP